MRKQKLTNFEAEWSAQLLPRHGLLDEPHGVADGLFGGVVIEIVLRQGQGDLADLVRGHHVSSWCFRSENNESEAMLFTDTEVEDNVILMKKLS